MKKRKRPSLIDDLLSYKDENGSHVFERRNPPTHRNPREGFSFERAVNDAAARNRVYIGRREQARMNDPVDPWLEWAYHIKPSLEHVESGQLSETVRDSRAWKMRGRGAWAVLRGFAVAVRFY